MPRTFFFDPEALSPVAEAHREQYRTAQPFPHVVIDGLLPDDVLFEVVEECPGPDDRDDWKHAQRPDAEKWSIKQDWTLGPTTRQLLNQLNSASFINFLEVLTGITGLIPDPHYEGGGLHQIERNGFLKVHADFNWHPHLQLDRRLNALLYLNPDWQDDWGGQLELWNPTMAQRVDAISPIFNRLVVFSTTDTSFHGHPDPLRCPPGTRRRSLALYYYTNGRPEKEKSEPHLTLQQLRPGEPWFAGAPMPPAPVTWRDWVPPRALHYGRKMKQAVQGGASRPSSH